MLPCRDPDREPAFSALSCAELVTGGTGFRSGRTVRSSEAVVSSEGCVEGTDSSESKAVLALPRPLS